MFFSQLSMLPENGRVQASRRPSSRLPIDQRQQLRGSRGIALFDLRGNPCDFRHASKITSQHGRLPHFLEAESEP